MRRVSRSTGSRPGGAMILDLPNWGEAAFAAECAEWGLVANKAVIDRFGWDWHVELDRPPVPGLSHDDQAGSVSGRVQVKTKKGGGLSVSVKLSNAVRFAKEPTPCFIVLYHIGRDGEAREYVREFGRELMTDALRRARTAYRDSKALHLVQTRIPFGPEHACPEGAASAIRDRLIALPIDHAEVKRRLSDTLGYEGQSMHGTIRLPRSEIGDFVSHALGLGPSVAGVEIELRQDRFGIASSKPIFAGRPDRFELRVQPEPAILTLAGEDGRRADFPGDFRMIQMPGTDDWRASFVSRFMLGELDIDGTMTLTYRHRSDHVGPLDEVAAVAAFHVVARGEMEVRLAVEGREPLATAARTLDVEPDPWTGWYDAALTALTRVRRPADDPELCLDDLSEAFAEVSRFLVMLTDGDLDVAATPYPGASPPRCRNLLGHAQVGIGGTTYAAIVRRPCIDEIVEPGRVTYRFGDPVVLEGAARRGPVNMHLPKLRRRFDELLARLGGRTMVIDDGDLMARRNTILVREAAVGRGLD